MKISKSTTILINVALVLLIAILVKSLVASPKNAGAAQPNKQFVVLRSSESALQDTFNKSTAMELRFVAAMDSAQNTLEKILIFEK
jgi:hypothetical protein